MSEKPLLLLIEDDPLLGEVYRDVLERPDIDLEWIQDGEEAQRRLRTIVPALVVLDLNLPRVSGLTLLQEIRQDARMKQVSVAVVTADGIRAREVEKLANAVLVKPVRITDLDWLVTTFLYGK